MLKEKIVCTINKMQVCLNKLKTQSIIKWVIVRIFWKQIQIM